MQSSSPTRSSASLALGHLERAFRAPPRFRGVPLERLRHRTLWISDLHLGSRHSRAEALLGLLEAVEVETLYLVGDIIDEWKLRRGAAWPVAHAAVLERIAIMARTGTRVIYVSGNHDISLRDVDVDVPEIEVVEETVHETADGRRLLVIHGDQFDEYSDEASLVVRVGDWSYQAAMAINLVFDRGARRSGGSTRSLSLRLKQKVKKAVKYIGNFEGRVAAHAARLDVEGVVAGHIHRAEIRRIGDILYLNDGDWVESCTGLVEDEHGRLCLYRLRAGEWRVETEEPERAEPDFPARALAR
ncbi:MAG: UDP-2,3-diacylglucosamine diphosphatase [Planctomycetota bacterium]